MSRVGMDYDSNHRVTDLRLDLQNTTLTHLWVVTEEEKTNQAIKLTEEMSNSLAISELWSAVSDHSSLIEGMLCMEKDPDSLASPGNAVKTLIWNPEEPLPVGADNIKLDEPMVWLRKAVLDVHKRHKTKQIRLSAVVHNVYCTQVNQQWSFVNNFLPVPEGRPQSPSNHCM